MIKGHDEDYDIAVIGAGAAGSMAAIRAGSLGRRVVLIERNASIGRKILITGKGRCNITNAASIDMFIKKFNPGGEFFRTAFFSFSNEDLMDFFESRGLGMKVERQLRVFPVTDKSSSVVSVLEECLKKENIAIEYDSRIVTIEKKNGNFILTAGNSSHIEAKKVIIASGGASYKETGSTGDGFKIAGELGHKIMPLKPALVPLRTKETWVKDLQGLALENIRIKFFCPGKKLVSEIGELMFTHFGVSGPLVLDMSHEITASFDEGKEIRLAIDLKPGMTEDELAARLIKEFADKGTLQIKNLMQELLPRKLIPVFLLLLNIDPGKRANQISKLERRSIIDALKALPLTICGSLPIEEAMVTAGGVSRKEIDPRSMESKLVSGLYFAGEIIDGAAPSGGYNLQQAFSTGYLAGGSAADSFMK
jgi:predicted Rossmann fold flavoprotein